MTTHHYRTELGECKSLLMGYKRALVVDRETAESYDPQDMIMVCAKGAETMAFLRVMGISEIHPDILCPVCLTLVQGARYLVSVRQIKDETIADNELKVNT